MKLLSIASVEVSPWRKRILAGFAVLSAFACAPSRPSEDPSDKTEVAEDSSSSVASADETEATNGEPPQREEVIDNGSREIPDAEEAEAFASALELAVRDMGNLYRPIETLEKKELASGSTKIGAATVLKMEAHQEFVQTVWLRPGGCYSLLAAADSSLDSVEITIFRESKKVIKNAAELPDENASDLGDKAPADPDMTSWIQVQGAGPWVIGKGRECLFFEETTTKRADIRVRSLSGNGVLAYQFYSR